MKQNLTRTLVVRSLSAAVLGLALVACTSSPTAGTTTAGTSAVTSSSAVQSGAVSSSATGPTTTGASSAGSTSSVTTSSAGTSPAGTGSSTASSGSGQTPGTGQTGTVTTTTGGPSNGSTGSAPFTPGDISKTVASQPVTSKSPVPLTSPAQFSTGVTARISSISSFEATAHGPGESSGPAYRITIAITNSTSAPLPVDAVNVTVADAAATPLSLMTGPPAAPFSGSIPAGATKTGTYVFAKSSADRQPIVVTVAYSAEAPVLVFRGTAS